MTFIRAASPILKLPNDHQRKERQLCSQAPLKGIS
jgi:hypothetical protein